MRVLCNKEVDEVGEFIYSSARQADRGTVRFLKSQACKKEMLMVSENGGKSHAHVKKSI